MDQNSHYLELLQTQILLPQNLTIGSIIFLIIINALSMSFDTIQELPKNSIIWRIHKFQPQQEIFNRLKAYLNLNAPERFSCGEYRNRRSLHLMPSGNFKGQELILSNAVENERQVHILIMLSFYMGYAMSHLPGVQLSEYFNGIRILCKFQAISFLVAIIPWPQVGFNGWRSIILIRSIMGFSQGTILRILGNMSQNRLPGEGSILNQFVQRNGHAVILLINIQGSLLKFFFKWFYFYYSMNFCAMLWILCLLIAWLYNETSFPSNNHQENNILPANPSMETIVPHVSSTPSMLSPIRSEEIENFLRPSWWNLSLNTMQYHWTKTLIIAELNHLILDLRGPHILSIISITLKIMIPFLLCWLLSLVVRQLFQSLTNQGTLHPRQHAKLKIILATYFPLIFSDFASCLMSCNKGNSWEMIFNCAISVMVNMHSNINLKSLEMQLNTSPSLSSFGTLVHELGSITNIITVYFENLLGEEVNFEIIS